MRVDTTGFHPPPEKSLEVTFHVLLPTEVWNWGKKSHIHMRFGHPRLGEWIEDVGEFILKRYFCLICFINGLIMFFNAQRSWKWPDGDGVHTAN